MTYKAVNMLQKILAKLKTGKRLQRQEVVGGMKGRVQEIHTNLQDGVSKWGRELTHVLHEVMDNDHRNDSRAPATPKSNQDKADQQEVQKENDLITDTGQ
ncbi:hypothetical protein KY285_023742 [Solanum tuberosum]|nr:hypothetical protein KY289_024076 [Solanum tuberosum]KAH0675941.1 hypothetical protein KY285_023742 [Solanum tuberosum]